MFADNFCMLLFKHQNTNGIANHGIHRYNNRFFVEETTSRRRVRGRSRGVGLENLLGQKEGKLSVNFNEAVGQPVCLNRKKLTSELGVIVRSFAPLKHKSWTKIPLHDRETLMERVKAKFWIDMTVPYVWDFVHNSMGKKYNSYRSKMNSYFADLMKDHPIERVKDMPFEDVTKDKWAWLCNHFNSDEFKYNHCGGSMLFVARHEMKKQETGDPSLIQVFYDTHTRVINKETKERVWMSDEAQIQHEKMIALQIQGREEGVEPRDEAEICAEVLGRKKKRRRSVDTHAHQENEALREQLRKQEEQIRQMKLDQDEWRTDMMTRIANLNRSAP
ncbi:hypothetical protein MKW94_007766 [Papaver nudicaule]|uniref:Transposase, Ptta/En/Spm, plant n=1 Tax=Papaver nudicaule TaxID=74823 RepID=A0AA42AT05_PAPNU|nr:hypothetical protein [Papaver nudicaule]